MLGETDIYEMLDAKGIAYECIQHKAVFTVEEAEALSLPPHGAFVKNLFLCDDKKRTYYVICMPFELHTNLKLLPERIQSRRLRFANADLLPDMLGVRAGSVTPFGVLNDETRCIELIFDASLEHKVIAVHPLVNTATVYLSADDICALALEHGTPVRFVDLS